MRVSYKHVRDTTSYRRWSTISPIDTVKISNSCVYAVSVRSNNLVRYKYGIDSKARLHLISWSVYSLPNLVRLFATYSWELPTNSIAFDSRLTIKVLLSRFVSLSFILPTVSVYKAAESVHIYPTIDYLPLLWADVKVKVYVTNEKQATLCVRD